MAINPAHYQTGTVTIAIPEDPTFIGTSSFDKIAVAGATPGVGDAAAFGGPVRSSFDGTNSNPNFVFGSSSQSKIYQTGSACYLYNSLGNLYIYNATIYSTEVQAINAQGSFITRVGGAASTNIKSYVNVNGVTVGTAAPTPTAGRAFQVSTTAFANSLYVQDSTGHLLIPNNDQHMYFGLSNQFRIYAGGAANYINSVSNTLNIDQNSAHPIQYRITSSGSNSYHAFFVGGLEVFRMSESGASIHASDGGIALRLIKNDTASSLQSAFTTIRAFNAAQQASLYRAEAASVTNYIDIGRGDATLGIEPLTNGRLYATTSAGTAQTGVAKLHWSNNGVAVGTAPPLPVAGRAFQVSTTAFANTLSVSDDGGHVSLPNDLQELRFGAGSDLRIVHQGPTSLFQNLSGLMYFLQAAPSGAMTFRCSDATAGDFSFQTRGANTRFTIGTDITLTPASKTTNYGTFVLGTDSADTSDQNGYVLCRPYSGPSDTAVVMMRLTALVSSNTLYIAGSAGYTAPTNTIIYGGGGQKFWATSNGVVIGTSVLAPTSGRAFQVSTTAFANAFYVADSTGNVHLPNDNHRLYIGAGNDLQLYHNGTNSYLSHGPSSGSMIVSSTSSIAISCTNASAGDITFNTRNGNERFRANGFAGINLAQGDPTGGSGTPPALQLFWSDTGDNKLIAVDPSGATFSVDLTAL